MATTTKPIIHSQPADTGYGSDVRTQVQYAVEHMKKRGSALSFDEILSYLSQQHAERKQKLTIAAYLQRHPKVSFDASGGDGDGVYKYKPTHNVHTNEQLIGLLQSRRTFQGLAVKELLDGWPDVNKAITELEGQGKVLVMRNKKDGSARAVWPDDPTLRFDCDEEFKAVWQKIKVPPQKDLPGELEKEGLTPTNKRKGDDNKIRAPEKKNKKARRTGKTTNTHMLSVLRDYSHLKR